MRLAPVNAGRGSRVSGAMLHAAEQTWWIWVCWAAEAPNKLKSTYLPRGVRRDFRAQSHGSPAPGDPRRARGHL
jgi:hypothetical protein